MMKTIADIIVYGTVISFAIAIIILIGVSMRMAAREREYVRQRADKLNDEVKRARMEGRWNDSI
jgi:hypothetical protein